MGMKLRTGLAEQARAHGFGLRQTGPAHMPQWLFDDDSKLARGNFFVAEAARGGVLLHSWHNMFLCLAHRESDIVRTLQVTDAAFAALRKAGL
jgi:glutamate-1-semialdehyde 2,1-aminomutase